MCFGHKRHSRGRQYRIRFILTDNNDHQRCFFEKEVIIDKYDLYEMIRANRNWTGIRVIRVDE